MTYRMICICLAVLFFIQVYAQSPEPGNAKSYLSPHFLLKDTGGIMTQLRKAQDIALKQHDSSMMLCNQALQSSEALGFNKGMAEVLLQIGVLYQDKSDFSSSIPMLQSSITYCDDDLDGLKRKIHVMNVLGDSYWYSSRADSAAYYYYNSLDNIKAADINDPSLLLETYSKLVLMWVNLNDNGVFDGSSADKYTKSAIEYFNKAVRQKDQKEAFRFQVLLNLGNIKKMEKKYDSAKAYYYEFINMATSKKGAQVSPNGRVVATLINISQIYLAEYKSDSAILTASRVIDLIGNRKDESPIYYIVANYLIGHALCQKKNYVEAIKVTQPAQNLAKKTKMNFAMFLSCQILAEAYEAAGNYQKAFQQQKMFATISDSIKRNTSIQAISEMEMRYRTAENKKELAEKELALTIKDNRIKNQHILILAISVGALLILLIVFLLYRHRHSKQRIKLLKVEQEMEVSHMYAVIEGEEKERVRLAQELHDGIGGLLGSIRLQLSSALKTYKTEDRSADFSSILKLLEAAYADLRKTAHNLMPEALQQEGLEKAIRLFCRNISSGSSTEVGFEMVGNMPPLSANVELSVYRITQELVHNIFKHANARRALVQLEFIDDCLALTVEDDGMGIDEEDALKKTKPFGMGLHTIRNRVKSLGGSVDISGAKGEGTSIYIELTIKGKYD